MVQSAPARTKINTKVTQPAPDGPHGTRCSPGTGSGSTQLCGGSRRFAVDVYIGWTVGNPVKLDGGNVNVIDSGYAKTTVVPDVTGRAQAQADDAIEANGLTTWPPDYVASARRGTIWTKSVRLHSTCGGERPARGQVASFPAAATPVRGRPGTACASGHLVYDFHVA